MDGKVPYALRRKQLASKSLMENPCEKTQFEKRQRSGDLNDYLKEHYADKEAHTERKKHAEAKPLMLTTPFVGGGFIDRKQLAQDPNKIFNLLGLEEGLKSFKFQG